jgi:hypothetical protein
MGTLDLRQLSIKDTQQKLGELLWMSLNKSRAAVFVVREDGILTLVNPKVLQQGMAELADELFAAGWNDEQVEEFLVLLDGGLDESHRPGVDPSSG